MKTCIILFLLLFSASVSASTSGSSLTVSPVTGFPKGYIDKATLSAALKNPNKPCWEAAAAYHGVDPWLLYSIAFVESSHNPRARSRPNSNGSVDHGLMQINSIWFPTLEKYGIPRENLYNACISTFIGAWVLSNNYKRFGNSWKAIAAYNVGNPNSSERRHRIGLEYARRVYTAYYRFQRMRIQGKL